MAASLILKKADYVTENGIPLKDVYITPIGLSVDDGPNPATSNLWPVYRTLEDLHARVNPVGYMPLRFEGSIRESQPELYAIVAPAMLGVLRQEAPEWAADLEVVEEP